MRFRFFCLIIILFTACSSSSPLVEEKSGIQLVSIHTGNVIYEDESTQTVTAEVKDWLLNKSIPENANINLEQILKGLEYSSDIPYRLASNQDTSDIEIHIKNIKISRRNFTLNFAKRGPILKLEMDFEIFQEKEKASEKVFMTTVNMAEIVGRDKSFYKLSDKQIEDPEIQKLVLDEAIDSLLGSSISTILGIRYE